MKKIRKFGTLIVLIVLGLIQTEHSLAQSIEEQIYKNEFVNCKVIANNSQKLIASLDFNQRESINQVLQIWQKECGLNEPIGRIQLLFAVQDGKITEEDYLYFYDSQDTKYETRVGYYSKYDAREAYEYNQSYYNNLPLQSALDEWTSAFAQQLISHQKKNTDAYLICLLLTNQFEEYHTQTQKHANKEIPIVKIIQERFSFWESRGSYTFFAGTWIPTGASTTDLGTSPYFGITLGSRVSTRFRLDLAIEFVLWNKELEFNYDSVPEKSNSFLVNFGVIPTYETRLSDNYYLDISAKLLISNIDSGIEDPDSQEGSNYSSTVPSVGLGMGLRRKISRDKEIGFQTSINYARYSSARNIDSDLPNSYMNTNVFYRF